ncbi:MAG: hypothetical protein M3Y49_20900 [Actinomycetota bacterium]|nr:hypothetical protein [Actinomycetota bacterium]
MHHLRVRPDRNSWAVTGYSAGGFCAQISGFLHPDRSGAALLFGSYDHPIWGAWRPYGQRSAGPTRYDLLTSLRHRSPATDVWMEVSDAGHRFEVRSGAMPTVLRWLSSAEPGFGTYSNPGLQQSHSFRGARSAFITHGKRTVDAVIAGRR